MAAVAMDSLPGPQPVYTNFSDIVGIVFNNWTAIKLAVEHGMGGPPAVTKRKLITMVETVSQSFTSGNGNTDWYEISDLLAESMDSEFSTLLEDNSNDEVAVHLCQLYQMFQTMNHTEIHTKLALLPAQTPIHLSTNHQQVPLESSGDEEEEPEDASQDDGWTVVKRK